MQARSSERPAFLDMILVVDGEGWRRFGSVPGKSSLHSRDASRGHGPKLLVWRQKTSLSTDTVNRLVSMSIRGLEALREPSPRELGADSTYHKWLSVPWSMVKHVRGWLMPAARSETITGSEF